MSPDAGSHLINALPGYRRGRNQWTALSGLGANPLLTSMWTCIYGSAIKVVPGLENWLSAALADEASHTAAAVEFEAARVAVHLESGITPHVAQAFRRVASHT